MKKNIFHHFKGLSMKQIKFFLEGESRLLDKIPENDHFAT